MKIFRRVLVTLCALVVTGGAALVAAGFYFSKPANHPIGPPPLGLAIEKISIDSESGSHLSGWFLPGKSHNGAVVLMHGWTASRLTMLDRMKFLNAAGYSTLAFDFQAHGESPGERITFGEEESLDAEAAVAWMKDRVPDEKVGVIGISMGGASALMEPDGFKGDALVIESVFPDMKHAVSNRLSEYLGPLSPAVATVFMVAVEPAIQVDGDNLRPIDHIGNLKAPVFVISGAEDKETPIEETRALFARAPEPKQIWEVKNAGHVDLDEFAGPEYRSHILAFFDQYLRSGDAAGRL